MARNAPSAPHRGHQLRSEGETIVKYGLVGVGNTLLTFLVFEGLLLCGTGAFAANLAGYAAGFVNSFVWNRRWVFRAAGGNRWRQAVLFALGAALCYGVQCLAFAFFLRHTNAHLAQIGGMVVYTALNYVYNRLAGAAPKDCITVAVLSLNDFHGAFIRDARKGIPGAAAIWQTVDSLKRVYPYHVTVAAGDNFGGSYFSTATDSRLLPVFFNDLGIRISAVGNHEFDNGTAWLAQKWAGSDMLPRGWELTYVCANVADASGRCPSYMQPFATEEIKLPSGRSITVAFVGLITSSTPLQTRRANTAGLSFDGRYDAVTATLSRRPEYAAVDSADVRILLTHIGTKMSGGSPAWHDADSARIAAFADPRFHAILSAHSHEAVCGRINDGRYPIVQGEWHGNYIGLLKLTVDTVSMTVRGAEAELCPVRPDVALGEGPQRSNRLAAARHEDGRRLPLGPAPHRLPHDAHPRPHQKAPTHRGGRSRLHGLCRGLPQRCPPGR